MRNALTDLVAQALARPASLSDDNRYWAWVNTAGGVHVEWCYNDYNYRIWRDAPEGSIYYWEADHHPIPRALGGPNHPNNLRALHRSVNRYLGGVLGNALR